MATAMVQRSSNTVLNVDPLQIAAATLIKEIFKSAWKTVAKVPDWIKKIYETNDPFGLEADRYAGSVLPRYNSMRIVGMESSVPLDDIYITVNILDEREQQRALSGDYWEWRASEGLVQYLQRGLPAVRAVDRHDKLLVLGRPGAGKTTFLKYLVIASLKGELERSLVPVFVSLKDWSRTPETKLETILIKQFEVCDLSHARELVRKLLRDGKCLVLLDGFDEIEEEQRRKGISQIEALTQEFPRSRFVLSCRTAANTYVFNGFTEVEVADFDDAQIQKFVNKWFEKTVASKFLRELMSAEKRGLLDLARNPLLLTLICIAYGETHSFPESRVAIYEIALDALLKKWDSSRNIVRHNAYKQLTLSKKELLLSRIAATGFEQGVDIYSISRLEGVLDRFMRELASDVEFEADDILDAIEAQHGIFVKVRTGEYRFSHLTFQEFYTAQFALDSPAAGLMQKAIGRHLGDARWNEVFVIAGGLQNDCSRYVYQLKMQLDVLRTHHVDACLELARTTIKNPNVYHHSVNVILALTQLLKEAIHGRFAQELRATADTAELTARRICEIKAVSASTEAAMLLVTQLGLARIRAEYPDAVLVLQQAEDSWKSLQRYLLGLHVLVSCLAGEATLPVTFRDAVIDRIFSPGCPPLPSVNDEGALFSA